MLRCPECGRTYPVAKGFCPMDGTPLVPVVSARAPVDGEARIGDVLDRRYRIDELIGAGGMAHVYRVTHTMIGKGLAAKVVRHELRNDDEVIGRFLREAQIVSSIKHPNVVDISDYGEMDGGGAYCVMELLRGRTLADAIDTDGALSAEEAVQIALQICSGLNQSHETGVVHRDLKPQNIFLCRPKGKPSSQTGASVVKLIDFGVARAGNRITVAGAVLGTPEYMSPEQVRGDTVDAGADLYALGVMLFEMLTAAVPYQSDDIAVTMHSHLNAPIPRLTAVDPGLENLGHIQALIDRLMAKRREDRPRTAADVAKLLQDALASDLGRDAAERVARSTLSIGSGALAQTAKAAAAQPWSDRQMDWNPELQSAGHPVEPESGSATIVVHDLAEVGAETPARRRFVPWLVAITSVLVVGATVGGYLTMRAQPEPVSNEAADTELVSAPESGHADAVPETPEVRSADVHGAPIREVSPAVVEQTPPPSPSVSLDSDDAEAPTPEITPGDAPHGASKADEAPPQRSARRDKANSRRLGRPRAGVKTSDKPKRESSSAAVVPPAESKPTEKPGNKPGRDADLRDPFG